MNKEYKIDWHSVIKMLLKFKLRKPKRRAGIYALLYPLVWLYNQFFNYLKGRLYELAKTSQVVYIRAALNDRWDAGLRRIEIIDGNTFQPFVIYRDAESKQAPYIYRESEGEPAPYIYTDSELNALQPDFIVRVPAFIVFDINEMKALVDIYKLFGRYYLIQTYS